MVMKVKLKPRSTSKRASARLTPFGPPPLVLGEDEDAYNELLARVSAAVQPADMIEEILVRDIADLDWDICRLRRVKANLITATVSEGLEPALRPLVDEMGSHESDEERLATLESVVANWGRRKRHAVAKVERLLRSGDIGTDEAIAYLIPQMIDPIERLDHLVAVSEARRNATLREIDRHRAAVGQTVRRPPIEEGEYQVVETKGAGGKKAA